jgi:hypothetical protein
MIWDGTARRRVFGAAVLGGALVMLILGETFLKGHLRDVGFLIYWGVCFLLTITAIVTAYVDMKVLQRDAGEERKELLQDTLRRIEGDAKVKKIEKRRLPHNGGQKR